MSTARFHESRIVIEEVAKRANLVRHLIIYVWYNSQLVFKPRIESLINLIRYG